MGTGTSARAANIIKRQGFEERLASLDDNMFGAGTCIDLCMDTFVDMHSDMCVGM